MKKVLVVGGAGYVGGWLVDQLLAEPDVEVRVFDNLLYEDSFLKEVDFCFGDVTNFREVEPHLSWADTVIWLAAVVGDPACALNPERALEVNTASVSRLADSFNGKIIFTSTCSVYGAQDSVLTESSPLRPLSVYAESKMEAEQLLLEKAPHATIFRLGTLFGVGDSHSRIRADLVLNVLTARAVLEGHMTVFGGQQYRPLLHVRDVANAAILALSNENASGIYNLHCSNLTINQLAKIIQELVPSAEIRTSDTQFEDSRNYSVSSLKAESDLGFSADYSVEYGIQQVKDLITTRRIPDIGIARFSNVARLQLGENNR